ncbi:hypothetical protein FJ365_03550 [Candidatus Dependentiae bacterium]|nr:hypothetical protein [Candidatus Dependentiae bacterium]
MNALRNNTLTLVAMAIIAMASMQYATAATNLKFPSRFNDKWKLPEPGRGIVRCTLVKAKQNPNTDKAVPPLFGSVTTPKYDARNTAFSLLGEGKRNTNNTLNIFLTNIKGASAVISAGIRPMTSWRFDTTPSVSDNLDLEYWVNEAANVVLVKARPASSSPNAPYHTIFACNLYVLKDKTGAKILDKIEGKLSKFTFGGLRGKNSFKNITTAPWEPILPAGALPMVATGNIDPNCTPVIGVDAAGAMAIYGVSADGLTIQVMDQKIAASATPTGCWSNITQTGLATSATNKIAMIAANAAKGLFAVLANGDIYKATIAAPSTTFTKLPTTKGALKNFAAGQYNGADCLFMIDNSNNLWHQLGTNAVTQDSPAGAGVQIAEVSMANDGTVAALDITGNVYLGSIAAGPTITWTALPKTLTVGNMAIPLRFESICAISAKNFMAVTQEQQVVSCNGTSWAVMTLPDQSPVAGFNSVLADTNKNHIFISEEGNIYWCTDAMAKEGMARESGQAPSPILNAYLSYETAKKNLSTAQKHLAAARRALQKNKKNKKLQDAMKARQADAAAAQSAARAAEKQLLIITKAPSKEAAESAGTAAVAAAAKAIADNKATSSGQQKAIVAANKGKTVAKARPKTNKQQKAKPAAKAPAKAPAKAGGKAAKAPANKAAKAPAGKKNAAKKK